MQFVYHRHDKCVYDRPHITVTQQLLLTTTNTSHYILAVVDHSPMFCKLIHVAHTQ